MEMGDVTDDGLTSFLPFLAGGTSPGFPRGSARLPPSSLTPPGFDLHIDLLISSHSKTMCILQAIPISLCLFSQY